MTDILKLLSKPSKFTGEEKDWKPRKFSLMAYVGAVDKIMAAEAVTAMKSKVQVNMVDITVEQQQRSATMFSLLVQVLTKRALVLLQMSEESNGYEAMRKYEVRASKMLPGQLDGSPEDLGFRVCGRQGEPSGDDGEDGE